MALDHADPAALHAELRSHAGHRIACRTYGGTAAVPASAVLECDTCGVVLVDADAPAAPGPAHAPYRTAAERAPVMAYDEGLHLGGRDAIAYQIADAGGTVWYGYALSEEDVPDGVRVE